MVFFKSEILFEPFRTDISENGVRVNSETGSINGFFINISTENLYIEMAPHGFHAFMYSNRNGIDFLATTASRYPYSHLIIIRLGFKQIDSTIAASSGVFTLRENKFKLLLIPLTNHRFYRRQLNKTGDKLCKHADHS